MSEKSTVIQFDVLIKSSADGSVPSLENIDSFKPSPEDLNKCLVWFKQQDITVHPTEFGLAGETSREHFESVFMVKLAPASSDSPGPPFVITGEPHLPADIKEKIDQITISAPPQLF